MSEVQSIQCVIMKIWIVVIFFLVASCSPENETIQKLMQNTEQSPRKVLQQLGSIDMTRLSQHDRFCIQYIKARARYVSGHIRRRDTLLKECAEFFYRQKHYTEAAYLHVFIGKAYLKAEDYRQANLYYAEAMELATELKDPKLQLQVYYESGNLYARNNDEENAVKQFRMIYSLYKEHPELESERFLFNIGDCLLYLGKYDKALEVFQEVTTTLVQEQDSVALAKMYLKIAYSLKKVGKFEDARRNIDQLKHFPQDKGLWVKGQLLRAAMALDEKQIDSMQIYLHECGKMLNPDDLRMCEGYYYLLSAMYEAQEDYCQALYYFKKYDAITDSTYIRRMQVRLERFEEIQGKMQLQGRYLMLHNRYLITLLIAVLLIGIAIGIVLFFYTRARKRKLQYIEAETFNEKLNFLFRSNTSKLHELLTHNLEISRKIALLRSLPTEKNMSFLKRFDEIFYGKEQSEHINWEEIYDTINFLYDGFKDKLLAAFPELNEKEVQLCCLLKAGFDTNDIAFMSRQSIYSVQKRKTTIRKRLGMDEGENIIDFLSKRFSSPE